jgi:hypothetical protein
MPQSKSPLLTPNQRDAITGDFDDLDESDRTRLRNRIISILQDFAVLNENLPADEREKIFKKALGWDLTQDNLKDDSQSRDFMYALSSVQEFLWAGLRQNDWKVEQHERLIEEAIIRTEEEGIMPLRNQSHLEVQVDVDIDIERRYHPSAEEAREKYEDGYDLTGSALKRALTPIPRDELIDLMKEYTDDAG